MSDTLIEQLLHKSTVKRRSAAKKLRKQKTNNGGYYLLKALEKEILIKKTWETKYHIIMALGYHKYLKALPFLKKIINIDIEPMVKIGLGDTITKLELYNKEHLTTLFRAIENQNLFLCEGCIRALAIIRPKCISMEIIYKIINFSSLKNNPSLYWTCALVSDYRDDGIVNDFLLKISKKKSTSEEIKKVVSASLEGKHLKWNIL